MQAMSLFSLNDKFRMVYHIKRVYRSTLLAMVKINNWMFYSLIIILSWDKAD